MKSKGLSAGKDFSWKSYPKSRHDESAWAKRLPAALEMLFPVERQAADYAGGLYSLICCS